MDTEWESKFPLVFVGAVERNELFSDHTPILLSTGSSRLHRKHQFKFEHGWFEREGFYDIVKKIWEKPVGGMTQIQRWDNKICTHINTFLGGLFTRLVF